MIRVVSAGEAHLDEVLEIEKASIFPAWSEGALTNEIGRDDGLFAVALENETVAGFCIIRRAADEAELYQIAVRDDFRRAGIGDLLMLTAVRYCLEHGVVSLYLEVRRSNEAAIRLYKKHGFRTEGRRKNYYSSPVEDAVIMALQLTEVKNDHIIRRDLL
jgi:ribosomal-protein-alanine N-acetyltransferase